MQIGFALEAGNIGRNVPLVKAVPVELKDFSIATAAGAELSYFGYAFEIPWDDLDASASKTVGTKQVIAFRSHMAMLISSLPPRNFVESVAKVAGGDEILRRNYGDSDVASDYNFTRAMLNSTPRSVSPFGSREAGARTSKLLLIKAVAVPSPGSSGTYLIRAPAFQGFQYGNPQSSPHKIILDLFDDKGGIEFVLACFGKCSVSPISQSDINRISQTVVRISPDAVEGFSRGPNLTAAP
jgi:hypothetical protein